MSVELLVKKMLSNVGVQIQRVPHAAWDKDPLFKTFLDETQGVTLLDPIRCYMLYQAALRSADKPGAVAEIGVYRGGTARMLCRALPQKTVHLFDTFGGMPETDAQRDKHQKGDFSDTSLQAVLAHLRGCDNARFHEGFFPQTAGPVEGETFCFAHIDVDIYPSVLECCRFFYPRLAPQGALIFDDYGQPTCPGAKQAVDEFFADKPEKPFYLPTAQALIVKGW